MNSAAFRDRNSFLCHRHPASRPFLDAIKFRPVIAFISLYSPAVGLLFTAYSLRSDDLDAGVRPTT
jgi:hypothetical protein